MRGGSFSLAEIPGYVFGADDDERPEPYLRVSLTDEDAILDRQQVQETWEYLGRWLGRTEPDVTSHQEAGVPVTQDQIRTVYARKAQTALADAERTVALGAALLDNPAGYWLLAHHRQMAVGYATLANTPSHIELEPITE